MENLNEYPHPLEVAVDTVKNLGSFVISRFQGGAWAELAEIIDNPNA